MEASRKRFLTLKTETQENRSFAVLWAYSYREGMPRIPTAWWAVCEAETQRTEEQKHLRNMEETSMMNLVRIREN